jgi:hypothetical protein
VSFCDRAVGPNWSTSILENNGIYIPIHQSMLHEGTVMLGHWAILVFIFAPIQQNNFTSQVIQVQTRRLVIQIIAGFSEIDLTLSWEGGVHPTWKHSRSRTHHQRGPLETLGIRARYEIGTCRLSPRRVGFLGRTFGCSRFEPTRILRDHRRGRSLRD